MTTTTKAGGVRGWQLATGIRGISLFTSLSHERDDDNDRENRQNRENNVRHRGDEHIAGFRFGAGVASQSRWSRKHGQARVRERWEWREWLRVEETESEPSGYGVMGGSYSYRWQQSGTKWKGMRLAAIWKTWRLSAPAHVYVCRTAWCVCVCAREAVKAVRAPARERESAWVRGECLAWRVRERSVVGKNCNP